MNKLSSKIDLSFPQNPIYTKEKNVFYILDGIEKEEYWNGLLQTEPSMVDLTYTALEAWDMICDFAKTDKDELFDGTIINNHDDTISSLTIGKEYGYKNEL